ncbi:MAG: M3 family oligoendopeptidase [Clostridium sp.]|nr:M3 family oligoendopeptidase [Clostridium sp.]
MNWSLNELYTSFESKEYIEDIKTLDSKIEKYVEFSKTLEESKGKESENIYKYIKYNEDISTILSKLSAYSRLRLAVDVRDLDAKKHQDIIIDKSVKLTLPEVLFTEYIKKIENIEEIIDESENLKAYSFYLTEIKENSKYVLGRKEEVLISNLKKTGSQMWSDLQGNLTSTLKVDINKDEEKTMPLSETRNLAYSKDKDTRKSAYKAEIDSYEKIIDGTAFSLNGIKGEVLTLSKLRGYSSPLEETLISSRMTKEILDSMFTAIDEYLPYFRLYLKRKAEILGHEKGLPFYDLFAPVGEIDMKFSYPEAMEYIEEKFATFSEELAAYAKNAYENKWIDVKPREGKRGGAFCSNLHSIGESRIMTNFDGSFSNMITIAHELGHGYHGLKLKDESILNSSYPMPIAETASILSETIVMKAAIKEANEKEALYMLESSISDATQVIVDIYSRFLFEDEVFRLREKGQISNDKLSEIMIESQKKSYGDGLDEEFMHPFMWINKPHYYSGDRHYYNFPYAFGLLFSKGLYSEYIETGDEFISRYDELLRLTGQKNIKELAEFMEIDITKPDFFRKSLDIIKEDIDKFLELTENII